jgi:hypothetical protein
VRVDGRVRPDRQTSPFHIFSWFPLGILSCCACAVSLRLFLLMNRDSGELRCEMMVAPPSRLGSEQTQLFS